MAPASESKDYSDVETRRSASSRRRMTVGRKVVYAIGLPIARAIVILLNKSYRIEKIIGADIAERIIADKGQAYAPCYWHSQHIVCSYLMREWLKRGFRAGFIVSASVDGEVPARIAKSWGAEIIRGSSANTGALVLRDAQAMMKRGVSIVTTPDGPLGPPFEFKPGAVLMAKIGAAPMIPIAFAADRAWTLKTWDRFMIPKPFARIVIAVGEPLAVSKRASTQDMENVRASMQSAIQSLAEESKAAVVDAT